MCFIDRISQFSTRSLRQTFVSIQSAAEPPIPDLAHFVVRLLSSNDKRLIKKCIKLSYLNTGTGTRMWNPAGPDTAVCLPIPPPMHVRAIDFTTPRLSYFGEKRTSTFYLVSTRNIFAKSERSDCSCLHSLSFFTPFSWRRSRHRAFSVNQVPKFGSHLVFLLNVFTCSFANAC